VRLERGQVYLLHRPPGGDPRPRRPVVVVSRQTLCDSRADKVIVAPVNSNRDGRSTEVPVGIAEGLKHDSVINCDQLLLVPKSALTDYLGSLQQDKLTPLRAALRIALELD
jgi:mRNA interferase MazF